MANTKVNYLEKVVQENKLKPYKRNTSRITDVSKDFNAETIYIGSKGRNTKVHLRIYDKKAEQLS
ncbi:hypothetical protein [Senegalia massiliensis]|uniref:hypothetical protein n=1 Tax=Senegalia massiliensis TaxID=1720316 RepID=UPI0010324670|nr:hypothetical protein [Senegalia massiliensis]